MSNYSLRCLFKEIVLPFRMSSMPSLISLRRLESDNISRVSFMLSYLSFDNVIVSAIRQHHQTKYIKLSKKRDKSG